MSLLNFGARAGALPSEPKTRTPARAAAEASRAAWVSAVWEGALVIGLFLLVGGVGLYLRVRLALPL